MHKIIPLHLCRGCCKRGLRWSKALLKTGSAAASGVQGPRSDRESDRNKIWLKAPESSDVRNSCKAWLYVKRPYGSLNQWSLKKVKPAKIYHDRRSLSLSHHSSRCLPAFLVWPSAFYWMQDDSRLCSCSASLHHTEPRWPFLKRSSYQIAAVLSSECVHAPSLAGSTLLSVAAQDGLLLQHGWLQFCHPSAECS